MIFPIGDDQVRGGYYPYVTYSLIIINAVVFFYEVIIPPEEIRDVLSNYGLIPMRIMSGGGKITFITSLFLHAGWAHFLGNLLFLWVFADNIEASIGSYRFLMFYFFGGIVASMFHVFMNQGSLVPTIGASGAISGVLGTYILLFPRSQIKVIFIFFFFTFRVPAVLFLGFWIGQQFFNGLASIGSTSEIGNGMVAWWAHIGGVLFGLLCGLFFRKVMNLRGRLQAEED